MKHTVPSDGQPPTVAFTGLAQLYGQEADEAEMSATLFTSKNCEGRTLTLTSYNMTAEGRRELKCSDLGRRREGDNG